MGVRLAPSLVFGYATVMLITVATSELLSVSPLDPIGRHWVFIAVAALTAGAGVWAVLRGEGLAWRSLRLDLASIAPGLTVGLLVISNFIRGGPQGAWLFLDWDNTANLGVIRHTFQAQGISYFEAGYSFSAYPHGLHALPIPYMGFPGSTATLGTIIDGLEASFAVSAVLLMLMAGALAFSATRLFVPGGLALPTLTSLLLVLILVVPVRGVLDGTFFALNAISPGFLTMLGTLVLGLGVLAGFSGLQEMRSRSGRVARATLLGIAFCIAALASTYQPLAVVFAVTAGIGIAARLVDVRTIGRAVWIAALAIVGVGLAPPLIAVVAQYGVGHGSIKGGTVTISLVLLGTVSALALFPLFARRRARPLALIVISLLVMMVALALAFYHQTGTFNRDAGTGENYYARKVELMLLWYLAPIALAVAVWLVSRVSRELAVITVLAACALIGWQTVVNGAYGVTQAWPARLDQPEIAAIRSIRINDPRSFASAQLSTNGLIETLTVNRGLHDDDFTYPWGFYVQGLPVTCDLVGPGVTVIRRGDNGVVLEDCK
jgi:hypothetical protein